jgi:hypothetical protein
MITAPVAPRFTAHDDLALGPAARVYRLACAHGVSSALLMSGGPIDDGVVLDLLLAGHRRSRGCRCESPAALETGHPTDA